jgi:hypothetical protein
MIVFVGYTIRKWENYYYTTIECNLATSFTVVNKRTDNDADAIDLSRNANIYNKFPKHFKPSPLACFRFMSWPKMRDWAPARTQR